MLKSLKRVTYCVDDVEKAKHWYQSILGVDPVFESPFAVVYKIGNSSMSLVKAMSPLIESGQRMDVYWEVDDIDFAVETFIQHGAQEDVECNSALFAGRQYGLL